MLLFFVNRCEKTCSTGTEHFSWLSVWPQTKSLSYQRNMQSSSNSCKFSCEVILILILNQYSCSIEEHRIEVLQMTALLREDSVRSCSCSMRKRSFARNSSRQKHVSKSQFLLTNFSTWRFFATGRSRCIISSTKEILCCRQCLENRESPNHLALITLDESHAFCLSFFKYLLAFIFLNHLGRGVSNFKAANP